MIGIAVFNKDKLVGELTAEETLLHNLIRNDLDHCNISIPNPQDEKEAIDLYVYNKSSPKIKVEIVNGSPYINLDIKLNAKILSINENSKYLSKDMLADISTSASQYIQSIMSDYLYKTSKEFEADIDGFGRYCLKHFSTADEYKEYDWLSKYKNAFFNISINTNVQSTFLFG